MAEKFDLNKMLKEIEEDERLLGKQKGKLSQDAIKKMMQEKARKSKEN